MNAREINCTACGERSLVRVEAVYEGFRKTGETFTCLACGHAYPDAASTPFALQQKATGDIFSTERASLKKDLLEDLFTTAAPRRHSCLWCRHYTVAAFDQRCGLTNDHVEPLESCERFEAKAEKD